MNRVNYTVIIPHFSKGDTCLLNRAVSSIPQRDDLQVLVVDNSPIPIPDSLFIDRSDVTILYSDNSRFAGGARNVGIGQSKGKWLIFMDADDFFTQDAFEIFDEYKNSNNDIIYFKSNSKYSDTLENANRSVCYNTLVDEYLKTADDMRLRTEFNVPWAKMINRSFIEENNILFDEVPASNDMMFSLLSGLAAHQIAADAREVYCVTVSKGSITNSISLRNLESQFDVNIRINAVLVKHGLKKNASVMYFIYQSLSFGIRPFLKFVYKALITGNLLVGWKSWIRTLVTIKRYKQYEINA